MQLRVYSVESRLGHLEQHENLGFLPQNLPAQFRADRTACARDDNGPASDLPTEQTLNRLNLITPQQVIDFDIANVIDTGPTLNQVAQVGHDLHAHGQRLETLDD